MARLRPTEVRAVAALLEEPAEDADELAGRIIETLDELRLKRDSFALLYLEPNTRTVVAFGPYGTQNAGERDIKRLVSPGPKPGHAQVLKLRPLADL